MTALIAYGLAALLALACAAHQAAHLIAQVSR